MSQSSTDLPNKTTQNDDGYNSVHVFDSNQSLHCRLLPAGSASNQGVVLELDAARFLGAFTRLGQ